MDWKAYMDNIGDITAEMEAAAPEVVAAYRRLSATAKRQGALELETRELIALSIAVAIRCEPCIGFHARALGALGAERDRVAEALGMAVSMQGGPGYMYMAKALEAFDQLKP